MQLVQSRQCIAGSPQEVALDDRKLLDWGSHATQTGVTIRYTCYLIVDHRYLITCPRFSRAMGEATYSDTDLRQFCFFSYHLVGTDVCISCHYSYLPIFKAAKVHIKCTSSPSSTPCLRNSAITPPQSLDALLCSVFLAQRVGML